MFSPLRTQRTRREQRGEATRLFLSASSAFSAVNQDLWLSRRRRQRREVFVEGGDFFAGGLGAGGVAGADGGDEALAQEALTLEVVQRQSQEPLAGRVRLFGA